MIANSSTSVSLFGEKNYSSVDVLSEHGGRDISETRTKVVTKNMLTYASGISRGLG